MMRRASAGTLFVVTWLGVIAVAVAAAALGIAMAGGPRAFTNWLDAAAPYALVWRCTVYIVGGTLYITRIRPRLCAMQQRQADGGEAGRARLVKIERMLVIVLVVIELSNLPRLVAWFGG